MKSKTNRIEELAAGYWSATLTPIEEQELREAVAQYEGDDEQIEALKVMMGSFEQMAQECKPSQPHRVATPRRAKIVRLAASFAAVAAMVAVALVTLLEIPHAAQEELEIYCYINGEPITDIEIALEQTKYFEQIKTLDQTIKKFESILN